MADVKQMDVLISADAPEIRSNDATSGLPNFVSGIVGLNLQGSRWHNVTFDIPFSFAPRSAVVSLALSDVMNQDHAVNLHYAIGEWSLSYTEDSVRVSVPVFVGDSDGFLRGMSYFCVAIS